MAALGRARRVLAAGALLAGFVIGLWLSSQDPAVTVPEAGFWDLNLATLEGDTAGLARFRGQTVLVNFWATWCAPCREEIPDLVRLDAWLAESNGEAVVVGVAVDDLDPVRDFVSEFGVTYPTLVGTEAGLALARALGNADGVLPFNAVVDPRGRIRFARPGSLTFEEARALLDPE